MKFRFVAVNFMQLYMQQINVKNNTMISLLTCLYFDMNRKIIIRSEAVMLDSDFVQLNHLKGDFLWPEGKRLAINFNIALEMWQPGSASSVNPMGNHLGSGCVDPNAESYGRYNVHAGARRLLGIVEHCSVPANVFTSGLVAEQYPEWVHQLAQAGHDVIGHSMGQDQLFPQLSEAEQTETIERSTNALARATGRHPSGWISPRITSDIQVQKKLSEHGYQWHGDVLDADLPYMQVFESTQIMAIPVTIEFNDLPHVMRFGRTPDQFVEMFMSALMQLRDRSKETLILDVIVHGHCYGRPAGALAFEQIVKRCSQDKSLWLTTRSAICDYVKPLF
jgi:peptidoglycan/xylan/chitin deacetylase (PgdA/CDA1 family)